MEVHAHSHTERKKWTHYFWEFLMLFLAVTLGFFVENKREHLVESKRAKEYAGLLVDDLNFDISELSRAERILNRIIAAGDTLGKLLSDPDIKKIPGGKLYYYEYWSGWRWNIISRDATLQQLKSSGSLRYLHNISLIRKILGYEETVKVINMLQNKYELEKTENWNLVQKVFYQEYFNLLDKDSLLTRDSTAKNFDIRDMKQNSFMNTNYPLFTNEKDILFELKNWAYNSSRNYRVIVHDIKSLEVKAVELIDALNKEYHLQ